MSANTFGSRRPLVVGGGRHTIHALEALDGVGDVSRLPFSLKILLENLLRNEDGISVTADDVTGLANWDAACPPSSTSPPCVTPWSSSAATPRR